jgi:hypothetical protein
VRFGAREASFDPVEVPRKELAIELSIPRSQARELDLHRSVAFTRRGEPELDKCRVVRRVVGFSTVPFDQHAVRGIDFDVAAGDDRPVEVKAERVSGPGSRHETKRWMASLAWF